MRSVLRQLIMRPRDVAAFSDDVSAVVVDLVKRIKVLRSQQADRHTVGDESPLATITDDNFPRKSDANGC